jgi:hypothetical protein
VRGQMGPWPELSGGVAKGKVWRLVGGGMRPACSHPLHGSPQRDSLLAASGLGDEAHGLLGLLAQQRSPRGSERGRHGVVCNIGLALAPVRGLPLGGLPFRESPSGGREVLGRSANGETRGVALSWD